MTAQQLKNSILQMAMQGKLVPQDKDDEPASVLLERIKAEKQALIKAGKIKKEKPLAPITEDEIPFEIPDSWKWIKLGDVLKISTGKRDANHETENGKYDFYTCSSEPIKADTYSFDGECLIAPGNGANVGLVIYHNGKFEAYQRTYVLERLSEESYMMYFKYAMEWNWKRYNADKMFGSATPYIKLGNLQNYCFPFPPLEEQKRIVAIIEELLPYIEKYDKAETKLTELNTKFPEALKKSILQEAVQGKLVPQTPDDEPASVLLERIKAEKHKLVKEGKIKKEKPLAPITEEEIPFDIPESWEWVRLISLCNSEISYGIIKLGNVDHNGVRVLRCSDVRRGFIDSSNIRTVSTDLSNQFSRTILNGGEVVITIRGTLGGVAVVPDSMKGYNIAREVAVIRNNAKVDARYLMFLLMSNYFTEYMFNGLRGIAYKGLNMGDLSNLPIPLPPLEEQKRIVAKIEELTKYCDKL